MFPIKKIIALAGMMLFFIVTCFAQQQADTWTANQLMEPSALAAIMNNPQASQPVILDVGPAGVIKGAKVMGPAHEKNGMNALKKELSQLPKNTFLVIYCGCCPFTHCPNIRPAFSLVNKMGFTNAHLLDLKDNLKEDWIDKGYPL
jgi:thiosulfate/3-mercaptopyruvate sulfurtransferase